MAVATPSGNDSASTHAVVRGTNLLRISPMPSIVCPIALRRRAGIVSPGRWARWIERMADAAIRTEMEPDPTSKLYIPPPRIDELSEPFGNSVHQTRSGL